ncbi:hypothetical protein [Desulfosporosinus hippei]|uniref:Uncharacterized protein n=1 Tax=Desulfosporosinus hippei DSM 8344 TaxID=1121419 RepID=A0A1G8H253_9FIRM|nr:hypothetical protein [Desulfosporosinus hippei]SDI00704.1 hypothetical protein SAMN05443529_12426 [Desulfosporosinus hippei DSM 8344]
MKTYVKPMLESYILTIEERFAAGSTCTVTGCCPDSGIEEYERLTGIKVNYSAGF